MSTSHRGSDRTVCAIPARSSLDHRSLARTPDVSTRDPTNRDSASKRASRAPGVSTRQREAIDKASPLVRVLDLGLQRLNSSPPSTLSVGYVAAPFGFPPETPIFSEQAHEPPSCRERVPDLVGLGWTSLPDVAAKEWFLPIRLPRKP